MAELHRPRRNNIKTELPTEITFFHILPRLPAKTLLRSMCVCKQWHSFLTTPIFAKIHLHHVTNNHHQNHHKLLFLSARRPCKFQTIDCEAPEDGLTVSRSLPFEASSSKLHIKIIASLNGLVCVGIRKCWSDHEDTDLILWNPLMGDYKTLSKPNFNIEYFRAIIGLYYSSSDDDYRLLYAIDYCNVYIYSLKSDSWRKVDSTPDFHSKRIRNWYSASWRASGLLNEKLYFLKKETGIFSPYSIIRFDLKTEKLTEIPLSFINQSTVCLSIMVVRGCIHLCVTYVNSRQQCDTIELWRMDGDGDWTKVVTCQRNACYLLHLPLLHLILRNGNWLMSSGSEGYIYKADVEKHTEDKMYSYDPDNMVIPRRGIYMETFVSPNQYHIN